MNRGRQTVRVDNSLRVAKVVFMPWALAPCFQPMGRMCVCVVGVCVCVVIGSSQACSVSDG